MADIIHRRSYDFVCRYDIFFKLTSTYRRQQKLIKALHDFTDKVIIERREKLLSKVDSESINESDENFSTHKKLALLDLLLQSEIDGKFLSNDDIREEIDTFMFEGHDTTSSALAFILYNLAKNQDIQQKCYEEIQTVIGDDKEKSVDMKLLSNSLCILFNNFALF